MRTPSSPFRVGTVLLAAGSMLLAACGGSTDSPVASAPPADGASTELTDDAGPDDAAEAVPTTQPATAPPSTTAAPTGDPTLIRSVIFPALDANAEASYAFTMGMEFDMSVDGLDITMGDSNTALATGTVDGGDTWMVMHIGDYMASMFESMFGQLADELTQAEVDEGMDMFTAMIDGFRGQTMQTWIDADTNTMVLDASEFFAGMLALEPGAAGELGPMSALVDGPVLIRLDEFDDALQDVLGNIGVTAGPSSPDQMLDMLRSVTDVEELGPGTVGGTDVTLYAATINVGAMYDAMGMDLEQLMAGDPTAADMTDAFDDFVMDITVAIDDEGQLRRMELAADLAGLMGTVDPSVADEVGQLSMQIWMDFDDYGGAFPFDPPAATDITDGFGELFGGPTF